MIFFVHIAKTAGSTMIRYFQANYRLGFDHCEAHISNAAFLDEWVPQAEWMTGHVTLPHAVRVLSPRRSDVRYVTCVRKPEAQVRSHYNWLIEIFHRGADFYNAHPPLVKDISERVRQTAANPSPARVAADLRAFSGLFLNNQSRYFLGDGLAEAAAAVARGVPVEALPPVLQAIDRFDAIADSKAIEALFNHLCGRELYSSGNRMNVNVSRYHVAPELFAADEVQETLRIHNRVDQLLHAHLEARMTDGLLVNRRSGPAGAPDLALSASRCLG